MGGSELNDGSCIHRRIRWSLCTMNDVLGSERAVVEHGVGCAVVRRQPSHPLVSPGRLGMERASRGWRDGRLGHALGTARASRRSKEPNEGGWSGFSNLVGTLTFKKLYLLVDLNWGRDGNLHGHVDSLLDMDGVRSVDWNVNRHLHMLHDLDGVRLLDLDWVWLRDMPGGDCGRNFWLLWELNFAQIASEH